LVNPSMRLITH